MILRLGFLWSVAALAVACSPPPTSIGDGGVVLPDTGPPDAARPDAGPTVSVVSVLVRDAVAPLLGATVLVDDVNGERHTATTGAGGRAMVPGVAWGTGRITITVAATNHPIQSLASFRRTDLGSRLDGTGTITIEVPSYYHSVNVSGHVTSSADASRPVRLYLDVSGHLDVTGTSFSGEVERGLPFQVFAVDSIYQELGRYHYTNTLVALATGTHAALTSTGAFDVDMSAVPATTTLAGSFPIPADGNRAQAGLAYAVVTADARYPHARYGLTTEMALSADGERFDYTLTRIETIDATTPVTLYWVETDDYLYSEIYVDGLPTAHPIPTGGDWPAPPALVTPDAAISVNLHTPITLTDVDRTMPVTVTLGTDTYSIWYLELPPAGTDVTIPAPPDGVDTSSWTNLRVDITSCEPWPGHALRCRRDAGGDYFYATL